jgi:hypothetical protein
MAVIENIKQSLSAMSQEQLIALLRDIRQSRRTPKRTTAAKPQAKEKKAVSAASLDALLQNMSPEDLINILAELEKGVKNGA